MAGNSHHSSSSCNNGAKLDKSPRSAKSEKTENTKTAEIKDIRKSSQTNQPPSSTSLFIKRLLPFGGKSNNSPPKSVKTIKSNKDNCKTPGEKTEYTSVKVLKQFWNNRISLTSAQSTENLDSRQKSATLCDKRGSQSSENLFDPCRREKSLTLYGKTSWHSTRENSSASSKENSPEQDCVDFKSPRIVDDFNKYKNADFIRYKRTSLDPKKDDVEQTKDEVDEACKIIKKVRPDSLNFDTSKISQNFPQIAKSPVGGKIHWAKREDIIPKKSPDKTMSFKTSKMTTEEIPAKKPPESDQKDKRSIKLDKNVSQEDVMPSSPSPSVINSNNSNVAATTSRKFSFRTTASQPHANKKLTVGMSNGSKVAQIAQRFNQMMQQDSTILEEVKKRGMVLHRVGGHVYKIKEDKGDYKNSWSKKKTVDDSDECSSLISCGKNSTRKKNSIKKRPSIRILIESPKKAGGNVVSKTQLYETNIIKKDTIVIKPKVPDKSDRVLAKTKELKKKGGKSKKTEYIVESPNIEEQIQEEINDSSNTQIKPEETYAVPNKIAVKCSPQAVPKMTQNIENAPELEVLENKSKESKSTYQKIYDKFMFRSSFLYNKKSPKAEPESKSVSYTEICHIQPSVNKIILEKDYEEVVEAVQKVEENIYLSPISIKASQFPKKSVSYTEISKIEIEPVEEYEDSIGLAVSNAADNFSKSVNDISVKCNEIFDLDPPVIKSSEAPEVKPNQSFLFRTQSQNKFYGSDLNMELDGMTDINLNDDPPALPSKENAYEIISKPNQSDFQNSIFQITPKSSTNNSNENIYQCLADVIKLVDSISIKSYESFETYDEIKSQEKVEPVVERKEDDYEICDPPEPPPPRKVEPKFEKVDKSEKPEIVISAPVLTSTTSSLVDSDDLPELPTPKRILNAANNYDVPKSSYEKIKYDVLPQRPQKSPKMMNKELPLPPRNDSPESINDYDSENIYDTIKNADNRSLLSSCYESIANNKLQTLPASQAIENEANPYKSSTNETMSIISSCYESINLKQNYSTINQILRHAISTTTLSSVDRTNSIYGTTVGQSLTPPSDRSGSDNSDEWIDLSDDEIEGLNAENKKHNFIVVCEKTKCHPDWSKKVRDHRLQQQLIAEWDVFVSSKSYIYINSSNAVSNGSAHDLPPEDTEPTYENVENTSIVPSDDNKFTIYVNYDFIKETRDKNNKSSVRLLEPDLNCSANCTNDDLWDSEKKTIQCQQISMYIDDSEHHYESLYSIQQQRLANEIQKPNGDKSSPKQTTRANSSKGNFTSNQIYSQDKCRDNDDEYDSFESDNDFLDHLEDGSNDVKLRNDSGVDVGNSKLPEPPSSTGQVYAIMQKIKNFGTLSKGEISKLSKFAKKKMSTRKLDNIMDSFAANGVHPPPHSSIYENTQFQEDNYVNTSFESKSLSKKSKGLAKLSKLGRMTINKIPNNFNLSDSYENTEFHSPRLSAPNPTPKENGLESSPILSKSMSNFCDEINGSSPEDNLNRKKKSFKSKFKKGSSSIGSTTSSSTSNIYSALSTKKSVFYVTDSVDVDSGIFAGNEKSTSSPDNSNSNLTVINEQKSPSSDLKRRSIAAISTSRPIQPPPPPPHVSVNDADKKSQKTKRLGTTSWYAECGLFKADAMNGDDVKNGRGEKTASTTSWYAETGLYQTSGNSVASSSGSSGVSTGGECSPCDDNTHSWFLNEPLYQMYTAAKLESISSGEFEPEQEHGDTDGYEEVGKLILPEKEKKPPRPTALQLIRPNSGPSRTLWSEVPEVIASEILSTLTINEKRLQEAKFEILTSEASYLKSLSLLRTHFMNHPAFRDQQILSSVDRKTLFSFIIPVQECSDRILCDLEKCWQDNIMLLGLSHQIYKHAERYFQVYIVYCEHQGKLDRTLRALKESKPSFKEALDLLENDPVCCGLNLHSFLMLPMQRITRLPLLIDAVMTKLKLDDDEFQSWKMTLAILNKIVSQCNQAANKCEQAFEMQTLSRQIEFPANITPFPIIPTGVLSPGIRLPRNLVRRGDLTHLVWRGDDAKLTFGKKFTKNNIYAFLFTDLLVLTKKKNDDTFLVFDYCQRSLLTVSSGDVIPQLPTKEMIAAGKHLILMTLLENYEGKTIEMMLSCPSETERQRWLQATEPPTSDNPDEVLYEQWDCPQVVVKHVYQALEPDELGLDTGDVVNVSKKMVDGWYYGERIRDAAVGWFPGNYTEEVASAHVRARNLKQRYRLLTFTASYLDSQKDRKK